MKQERLKVSSPFCWVGSKRQLAQDIINLMPPHRLYVEVFGGSLSVLYAKSQNMFTIKRNGRNQPYTEVVNDVNGELINLHRVIQRYPETLSYYLNQMLISRETFDNIKRGKLKPRNNIERASYYYFLLTQSFNCKGKEFAMSAKSRKPKNIYRSFRAHSDRLKFVTIENMTFQKLLSTYDREDVLFYLDPPYVGTERYYSHIDRFGIEQHNLLAEILSTIKGKFILSYNDCSEVRDLYKDFNIKQTKGVNYLLASSQKTKQVREIFITNF